MSFYGPYHLIFHSRIKFLIWIPVDFRSTRIDNITTKTATIDIVLNMEKP